MTDIIPDLHAVNMFSWNISLTNAPHHFTFTLKAHPLSLTDARIQKLYQ